MEIFKTMAGDKTPARGFLQGRGNRPGWKARIVPNVAELSKKSANGSFRNDKIGRAHV